MLPEIHLQILLKLYSSQPCVAQLTLFQREAHKERAVPPSHLIRSKVPPKDKEVVHICKDQTLRVNMGTTTKSNLQTANQTSTTAATVDSKTRQLKNLTILRLLQPTKRFEAQAEHQAILGATFQLVVGPQVQQ